MTVGATWDGIDAYGRRIGGGLPIQNLTQAWQRFPRGIPRKPVYRHPGSMGKQPAQRDRRLFRVFVDRELPVHQLLVDVLIQVNLSFLDRKSTRLNSSH